MLFVCVLISVIYFNEILILRLSHNCKNSKIYRLHFSLIIGRNQGNYAVRSRTPILRLCNAKNAKHEPRRSRILKCVTTDMPESARIKPIANAPAARRIN